MEGEVREARKKGGIEGERAGRREAERKIGREERRGEGGKERRGRKGRQGEIDGRDEGEAGRDQQFLAGCIGLRGQDGMELRWG